MGITMLKIRRSRDRLIFNMGIPILARQHLYIPTAPWSSLVLSVLCITTTMKLNCAINLWYFQISIFVLTWARSLCPASRMNAPLERCLPLSHNVAWQCSSHYYCDVWRGWESGHQICNKHHYKRKEENRALFQYKDCLSQVWGLPC